MFQKTKMVRTAIESMYTDTCSVYEYQEYTRSNKSTGHTVVQVQENIPCRLSFQSSNNGAISGGADAVDQQIKLFVSPDITIKSGSKISVTRNGTTVNYKRSGEPTIYDSHQEIVLVLFDGWA